MNKGAYRITKKALADLESIWLYTCKNWSPDQADRYYSLIINEIKYICQHPQSGRDMSHVRAGYRTSKVKSHLIFYRVQDDYIEVIRILHEKMDLENRLND
jgi:toxin ParE1/3/4